MSLLRFRDLKDRGIVSNHVTLKRWIEREGFPPGASCSAPTPGAGVKLRDRGAASISRPTERVAPWPCRSFTRLAR